MENSRSVQNAQFHLIVMISIAISGMVNVKEVMVIKIILLDLIENYVLDYLKDNLADILTAKVSVETSRAIPEHAYNKKRIQYCSAEILHHLSSTAKSESVIMLALIDRDLYVPELNFVFGQADLDGGICIVSLTRLRQSYDGLADNRDLYLQRALKETVHEIGHVLRLGHCPDTKCAMHFSNSLRDTDVKTQYFCNKCKKLSH